MYNSMELISREQYHAKMHRIARFCAQNFKIFPALISLDPQCRSGWRFNASMSGAEPPAPHWYFSGYGPGDVYAKRGLCRGKMSVRQSHVGILSKRLYVSSNFLPSGSPTIVVFLHQTVWQCFDRDLPNGGIECRGMKNSRFSTNVSLYLQNDTRYGYS